MGAGGSYSEKKIILLELERKENFSGVKRGAPTKRPSSKGLASKGPGMNGPASKGSEILKVRQRKVRPHNIRQEYFDTKRPKYI